MKAYWINVRERTISAVDYSGLPDLRRMVGGYIECAYQWPTGEVLYVDEEGGLKNPTLGFRIAERPDQSLYSNGVLVGREIGDTDKTADPKMTVGDLLARVAFVSFI